MDKKDLLATLKRRSALQQPTVALRLAEFFDAGLGSLENKEARAAYQDLLNRSITDPEAFRQLCELRKLTVNNFVAAKGNAASFFNEVTLGESDEPYLVNETKQEIKARFIGVDGKPGAVQAIKQQEQARVPLRLISTDEYEYTIVDPYKGHVVDSAQMNVSLADDLNLTRDGELWKLLKLQVGNFTFTGKEVNRTFHFHSSINVANVPTSNRIVLSNNTGASKFRFDVIRAITQYCMQWGTNTLPTGEVRPVTLYVPGLDVGGMLDEIDVTSRDNILFEKIVGVGYVVSLGNYQFNIVGDPQLDPTAGTCYLRTSVPVGDVYKKPSLDRIFPGSLAQLTKEEIKANKGSASMSTYYGAATPEPWRVGILAIKYRN